MEAVAQGGVKHNPKVALGMTSLLGETRHRRSKVRGCAMAARKDLEGVFDIPRLEVTALRIVLPIIARDLRRRIASLSTEILCEED
jgi:hypothetical protein